MINGTEYAWEDIDIVLLGKILIGVTEINYKAKKEQVKIYGRGKDPVAYGRSRNEYEASITLLQSEVEALQASLPRGKTLMDIEPFDITVSYAYQGNVVVDILRSCTFVEFEKKMKTGDTHMEIAIPLNVGKIDFNS